jgi:EmrB/QacA subfamily drug resistance transporter
MSNQTDFASAWSGLLGMLLKERPPARAIARQRYYPWLVVGTVCIGAFMGQADASVAQLVLPVLEREFGQSLSAISWVAIGYTLTLGVFLPIFGRLADLFGRKMLYTSGFLLFILGSGLCGAATSFGMLVGFRVFQAIGAALLQANSIAIVVTAAGERHRGRAIGLQAAAQAVGLSAGPAIGGFLIHELSWSWVFWINVPFGLVGAALGWLVLPQTGLVDPDRRFDWGGVAMLAPTLAGLVLMINEGQHWGVASAAFAVCALAVCVLLPLFIWREPRVSAPLLDISLFRRHAFWAGNLAGLLSYAMLFGVFFLMPFVFDRAYGQGPLAAGLGLTVIPVALGVLSPISGFLYDRAGPRALTATGMALSLAAFVLLEFVMRVEGSMLPTLGALALFGVGQGLFTSPNNSSVMAAAPRGQVGQAGGILNVTRSFGTSIGVAAASAVLSWRLSQATGGSPGTLDAPPAAMLAAAHYVVALFALFALMAGALCWARPEAKAAHPAPPDSGM